MSEIEILTSVEPEIGVAVPTAAQMSTGVPVPPISLLQIMSPDDWEAFTEEWLTFHKAQGTYGSINRYSGPGDLGLDLVALSSSLGFSGPWDSFQCKHYDHALQPTDVYGEVAKIIYHSFLKTPPFNQKCRVPRRHYFVSPKGVGITVGRLLKDPMRFKADVRAKWETHCVGKIGKGIVAPLEGDFLIYFDAFDFSIFDDCSAVQLVEEHSQTVFHAMRFGGGLPPRDQSELPPEEPTSVESPYIGKLLDAYEDYLGEPVSNPSDLAKHPDMEAHFDRQRVHFYSAESLRNFARDRTPPGTFDFLKEDIYDGVVDTYDTLHSSALDRLRATLASAAQVDVSGSALVSVTRPRDKQGVCHHLANDDLLTWVKNDE